MSASSHDHARFVINLPRLLLLFVVVESMNSDSEDDRCFCKLSGTIDDCCCTVETVDKINNVHIFPRISRLVQKASYFRYYKVNLKRTCPFWPDDSRCALKDCSVDVCSDAELPIGLKAAKERYTYSADKENESLTTSKEGDLGQDQCANGGMQALGDVNTTLSDEQLEELEDWQQHDADERFCHIDGTRDPTDPILDTASHRTVERLMACDQIEAKIMKYHTVSGGDENSSEAEYVDLLLNPERYTGYSGFSARRIWNSIYKENCFLPQEQKGKNYVSLKSQHLRNICLERRVFYRAISGLHASINIHLSYKYLLSGNALVKSVWGPNVKEFRRRFDPETTNGEAVIKAAPYWEEVDFYTGCPEEDDSVKDLILDFVKTAKLCPSTFDETIMFAGDPKTARNLKEEFKTHFRNVTRIMDCVGCDKCRLWGKLQTQGLGTALKILFSSQKWDRVPTVKGKKFRLSRMEIVSLFNVLGKYYTR